MNCLVLLISLLVFSITSFAQQTKPFKYVFSLGYGYFDLFREVENYTQRTRSKDGFNYKQTLVGPLYLKLEKNLNRRLALAACFSYERFSYDADFNLYKVMEDDRFGYYTNQRNIPYEATFVDMKEIHEQSIYTSFSSTLRLNFYFYKRQYFHFYMGLGVGYRMNFIDYNSTMHTQYPETIRYKRNFQGGQIYDGYLFPIGGEATFGFRGYFYKNLGFYTELGLAKSIFQTGLCFRIE